MLKKLSSGKIFILVISLIFTGIVGYEFINSRNKLSYQNEIEEKIEEDKESADNKEEKIQFEDEENSDILENNDTSEKHLRKPEKYKKSERPKNEVLKNEKNSNRIESKETKIKEAKFQKDEDKSAKKSSNIVNINTATEAELSANLKGIGKAKAKFIVNYRKEKGNFTTIEEIKNVKGIGEKTFENIRGYITV